MDEIWKKIPDCGEYYSVSNFGRVMVTGKRKWGHKIGKIIKPFDNNGYVRYNLYSGNTEGKKRSCKAKLAHVLVFEAFIGKIPDGLEINHIDGDKTNNRPENLQAVSASQNIRHAFDILKKQPSAHKAKFSWEQAMQIKDEYLEGKTSFPKLARKHGVHHSTIQRIVGGKVYAKEDLKNRPK